MEYLLGIGSVAGVAGCATTDRTDPGDDPSAGGSGPRTATTSSGEGDGTEETAEPLPDRIQLSELDVRFTIEKSDVDVGDGSKNPALFAMDRTTAYFGVDSIGSTSVVKYDIDAGEIVWNQNDLNGTVRSIRPVEHVDVVLVRFDGVTALDGETGQKLWNFGGGKPLVDGDSVWLLNRDRRWVDVDLRTGETRRKIYAGPFNNDEAAFDGDHRVLYHTSPAGCFALSADNSTADRAEIYARIAHSGANWPDTLADEYKLLDDRNDMDAISLGKDVVVFVGTNYVATFGREAITKQSGPIMDREIQKYNHRSLVTEGNRVYLTTTDSSSHDRTTHCYHGADGERAWSRENYKIPGTRPSRIFGDYILLNKGGTAAEYGVIDKMTGEERTVLESSQGVWLSTYDDVLVSLSGDAVTGYAGLSSS